METFVQAFILAFREGLEAFLIIGILLRFLDKTNHSMLKKSMWQGAFAGIFVSSILGLILMGISSFIGGTEASVTIWESIASFMAVILITTFIIWMMKHGSMIKHHVENKAALNLSNKGMFFIALFMVAREGAEIAIFQFAGEYPALPIFFGIIFSIGLVMLIHHSIVKIKLNAIFAITLTYLILQAGFLIGNSIHEGLSASKELGLVDKSNFIFSKAFDLSKTSLYHKEGVIGIPLYIAFGWHSKPEWIQFIVQYGYAILLFWYWYAIKNKSGVAKQKEFKIVH